MSDSNRGQRDKTIEGLFCLAAVIRTAVLIYAIGQNFGVGAGRNDVTAREHYEDLKQDNLRACTGQEGVAAIACVTDAIESAQAQSYSRQDLYAQRDMANFAFWLLVITGLTFGVTSLGVLFVKRTLDATVEAVKRSGDATAAMVRQNELTEASQRPWVSIDVGEVNVFSTDVFTSIEYQITLRNIGASAAENVYPSVDVRLMGRDLLIEIPEHFEKSKRAPVSRVVLLPKEEIVIHRKKQITNDHVEWFEHQGKMVAHCIILPFVTYTYADGEALWTFRPKMVKRVANSRVTQGYFTRQMPNANGTKWLVEPVAGQSTR